MKQITLEIVGGKTELTSTSANTVAQLLAEKGLTNYQANVNGESVTGDYELQARDWVILTPAVKGA